MTDSSGSSSLRAIPKGLPGNITYSCFDTDTKNAKFGYVWAIKKFSDLRHGVGEFIESSIFSANVTDKNKWRLILYPRGSTKRDYVSLYLRHYPEDISHDVEAEFEFSVLNNKGEKKCITKGHNSDIFKKENLVYGCGAYIHRWYLFESNELLENDNLTICCEVIIETTPENTTGDNALVKDPGYNRLTESLERLHNSKKFTDVVFVVEERELHAHKALLAVRSPVFESMFENDMVEKQDNRVVISDIGYSIMEELIRFVYTSKAPAMDEEMATKLLYAADKYALEDLKAMCEQTLSGHVTSENVVQLARLANAHNASFLKTRLIEFIQSNEVVKILCNQIISQNPELIAEAFQANSDITTIVEPLPKKKRTH